MTSRVWSDRLAAGPRIRAAQFLAVTIVVAAGVARAQLPDTTDVVSSGEGFRPFTLSGEIGTYGELYSNNSGFGRQAPSSGRLFFRPTLSVFDALTVNGEFLLSTDGNDARQDINQFGLNPTWSWGRAYIGDFSENYSQYTLGGIRIRGGGFFINPGGFRLGAIGGIVRRAVYGPIDNGAYERYMYGGRFGFGSDEGGFFDFVFVRTRDKVSSLSQPVQAAIIDSTDSTHTVMSMYEVKPQENLVAGVLSHLKFFDNVVSWNLEATGSMFTRDMTVTEKGLNLPPWVDGIYRANISSCAGLAVKTDVAMNFGSVILRSGYRYVGPGYNALGVGSMLNDIQEFSLAPSFRIGTWSVSLNALRQNDNLAGQKMNTLIRYQYGGNVNFQPAYGWTSSFLVNLLTIGNDADNDTVRVSYGSVTLGTTQYVSFSPGGLIQSATFSYIYQHSGDDSPLRSGMKFTSHSANAGVLVPLTDNLSLTPGVGLVVSSIPQLSTQTMQTYSLTAQHRAFDNLLMNVLSVVVSSGPNTSSFRSSFNSTYRLTGTASIGLTLSMMTYSTTGPYGRDFSEYIASLNVTQTF